MLLAYTVKQSIIIALDVPSNHLIVKIKNKQHEILTTYEFFQTDFEKIDYVTPEKILFLDIITDGQTLHKKLIFK